MDVITAYRQVGTYRGAAEMCGGTHETVKRILEKDSAAADRVERRRNYESVRALVGHEVTEAKGKISAKRLLPKVRAFTGELLAEHPLMVPGEASVLGAHYGRPRPNAPARKVTPRTEAERALLSLGPVAESWLRHAAASDNTRLGPELAKLAALQAAHGRDALVAAQERAITFGRWKASGVRSILAASAGVAQLTDPGDALVIELPVTASRPLTAYRLDDLKCDA